MDASNILSALDIADSERALEALCAKRDERQMWWSSTGNRAPRCELDDEIDAARQKLREQSAALQSRLDSNSKKAT